MNDSINSEVSVCDSRYSCQTAGKREKCGVRPVNKVSLHIFIPQE